MNILHGFTLFLCMMPYIGIGSLPIDIQPFAFISALFGIIIFGVSNKVISLGGVFYPVFLAFLIALITGLFQIIYGDDADIITKMLFGYTSSVVFVVYTLNFLKSKHAVEIATKTLDITLFIIFLGFLINIAGGTPLIQIFVSRAIYVFGDSARGLTSFFPEQSRIAGQFVYMLIIYYSISKLNTTRFILLFIMGLISGSGQFFLNLFLLLSLFSLGHLLSILKKNGITPKIFILLSLTFISAATFVYLILFEGAYLQQIGIPQRGIVALRKILNLDFQALGQDFGFLFKVSGLFQGTSSVIGDPFGLRVASSYYFKEYSNVVTIYEHLLNSIFQASFIPYPIKSYSIFGLWLSDLRIFGLILFSWLIIVLAPRIKSKNSEKNNIGIDISFFVMLFFIILARSNNSDPTLWVTIVFYTSRNLISFNHVKYS